MNQERPESLSRRILWVAAGIAVLLLGLFAIRALPAWLPVGGWVLGLCMVVAPAFWLAAVRGVGGGEALGELDALEERYRNHQVTVRSLVEATWAVLLFASIVGLVVLLAA